jgi:aminoglycoside 6'-N-acetyltransferase
VLVLRPATQADVELLAEWARRPHVVSASSDDPAATAAFGDVDWSEEVARRDTLGADVWEVLVAELDGRPAGMVQITDPHREPDHYWGDIEPNLRAIDIWIGESDLLGQGVGTEMMAQAIARCFADPAVTGIVIDPLASNVDAIRFYDRLGFAEVGPRRFGDDGDGDDCLVMRLDRSTRSVRASRQIDAPAEAVFELLADPAAHARWDGNDNISAAAEGQRVRAIGDVFVTTLTNGAVRWNHVVEFVEGRRIAWCPGDPDRPPAGHRWAWELRLQPDGSTEVTHAYDWSTLTDPKRFDRARSTTPEMLTASLDRLDELLA